MSYLFFGFWTILVICGLGFFNITPLTIALTFLLLIFLPGFLLARIFQIKFPKDFLGEIILALALGFIFNLFICFLAIFLGMTVNFLVYFYFLAIVILLAISLVLDFWRPKEKIICCQWQDIFQIKNLIYLFLLLLVVLVLAVTSQLGTNFTGDPIYHLAVIRKVVEGQVLSINNLSFTKNEIHLAYAFPVWHVFLGLLSKILKVDIFILYRELPIAIVPLVFLVWYWLFRKIMPSRNVAILALFLLVLYYFGRNGYLYTRLVVPDSLNNYLLMPLSFALAINYIFHTPIPLKENYKHLIVLSLLLFFMGLIHWTQYFYYLFGMGLLAILYLIFKFHEADFWSVYKKILLSIFANLILVLPMLAFLQHIISSNMTAYVEVTKGSNNDRYYKFTPYFQLAYVFLPVVLIFIRKYRQLIFLLAVFLVGPLVYNIPGVYGLCRHFFSHVFVNRLYSNLGEWPYAIWALILGFILVLIDRLLAKILPALKIWRYAIDGFLGILLVLMVWTQLRYETIDIWYKAIFSEKTHLWLNNNYHWLIAVVTFISLGLFFAVKYLPKLSEFFKFSEYKNPVPMLFLTLMLVFFLAMPAQGNLSFYFKKEIQNKNFFGSPIDPIPKIINSEKFGGMETIEFIRSNLPAKSVFDTNTHANYTLPTLVDVHMASMTFDPEPTKKYQDLYDFNIPIENKLTLLKEGDIDYLIYQYQDNQQKSLLDGYPRYFTKIFDTPTAGLFQVNKNQVQLDLNL